MRIEYIDKQEQLPELCARISKEPWVALDTEFLREKTYYPVFCLLQIASPEWVVCVDPIALPDLSSLLDVLNDTSIIKVLHSCRQDLEIFYQLTGTVMFPIFDTQIAAPLLGFQENPGYAMLVSSFLNINLSKAQTRTDWTIRPLSEEQVQYAADDVIYLCKIYKMICEQLNEIGRFDWLGKDFARLKNKELYQVSPENAWVKVKGRNRITDKQLSIVQAITEWRERTAQAENRPKNWLIRDDLVLELAKLQPITVDALAKIRNINERTVKRYGAIICQLIESSKEKKPTGISDKTKVPKKTQQQEAVLDVLTAVVRVRAEENSINPMILAGRKELEKLLRGEEDCLVLQGWRFSMVGQELQGLLQGLFTLSLDAGSVLIADK
ncbi:MAG: ribonuclease D [Methylococcales bacterium]|nr:ribonuclease D [Methylococcales bacterium]